MYLKKIQQKLYTKRDFARIRGYIFLVIVIVVIVIDPEENKVKSFAHKCWRSSWLIGKICTTEALNWVMFNLINANQI